MSHAVWNEQLLTGENGSEVADSSRYSVPASINVVGTVGFSDVTPAGEVISEIEGCDTGSERDTPEVRGRDTPEVRGRDTPEVD